MKLRAYVKEEFSTKSGRSRLVTAVTMIYNFVWSVVKILIGIFTQSYFFCVNGAGNLLSGLSKRIYMRNYKTESFAVKKAKARLMDILLFFVGMCYIIYMAWYVAAKRDGSAEYDLIAAIAIAAAATAETIIAIRNLVLAIKSNDPMLMALRRINTASAAFAVVLTQVALLSATMTPAPVYNAAVGITAGAAACLLAVIGIIRSPSDEDDKKGEKEAS